MGFAEGGHEGTQGTHDLASSVSRCGMFSFSTLYIGRIYGALTKGMYILKHSLRRRSRYREKPKATQK